MGRWVYDTFGQDVEQRLFAHGPRFCFGGYFATPLFTIHRHPIIVYEAMRIQQNYLLEDIDHFIERLWAALLSEWKPITCDRDSLNYSTAISYEEYLPSTTNTKLENAAVSLKERLETRAKFKNTVTKPQTKFQILRK
jgi:hypothetical protein